MRRSRATRRLLVHSVVCILTSLLYHDSGCANIHLRPAEGVGEDCRGCGGILHCQAVCHCATRGGKGGRYGRTAGAGQVSYTTVQIVEPDSDESSLKRRFLQNQEDVSYTIMALIPTLGEQILVELDVEGVTHDLQTKSRAFREAPEPSPAPELSESSMASSIQLVQDADTRSDAGSASVSSLSTQDEGSSHLGDSTQSWDQMSNSNQSSQPREASSPSAGPAELLAVPQLSDSITTASSSLSYANNLVSISVEVRFWCLTSCSGYL